MCSSDLNGDAPAGVTVHAHAFSRSALDKLQAEGSTAQRISWPDGMPVEDAPEASETDGAPPAKPKRQRAQASAAAESEEASVTEEASVAEAPAEDSEAEPEGESES